MRRLLPVVLLVMLGSGCGRAQTTQVGGKPVSAWVEALHGPDAKLRKKAVVKLGHVGPADPAVLPALLGALTDRDARVRREAILALVQYGPTAREAVPALTDLQQHDRDAQVREYAAKALAKLGGQTGPAP